MQLMICSDTIIEHKLITFEIYIYIYSFICFFISFFLYLFVDDNPFKTTHPVEELIWIDRVVAIEPVCSHPTNIHLINELDFNVRCIYSHQEKIEQAIPIEIVKIQSLLSFLRFITFQYTKNCLLSTQADSTRAKGTYRIHSLSLHVSVYIYIYICILYTLYTALYIYTYMYLYFTRTIFSPSAVSEHSIFCLFADHRCESEGHFAWPARWIEFSSRLILFQGCECDPWSTTQLGTS